jgi:high-affinity iron transporter
MLINSVVIVLREVLEAALMVSVLLAASRLLQISSRWLVIALTLGLVGAATYGQLLDPISELFEGVGQELFNALLQYAAFAALAVVSFLIARYRGGLGGQKSILPTMMAAAVALAVTREGSEILIYVTGFVQITDFFSSVGVGSLAGAAIGSSVGVLFYYLLLALPLRRALTISLVLLGLAAAGMSAQATGLLIQADWITVAGPVWDSSGFIAEDSLTGQLLYALIGYEASPSAIEVTTYVASIIVMALSVIVGWTLFANRSDELQ